MKKLYIGILSIFIISMLAACGSQASGEQKQGEESSDKKVLKMATSADFPPFESHNEKGDIVGFDVDLANKIADKLGYQLEIQDMKFDGLVGALQSGRVDMVMSGMSTTEKRRKNVDFSKQYHRSGEMFIYKKDADIKKLEDLKGKTVGVQLGTIQEEGADKLSKKYGFKVKKVDNANILGQELASNRIDVGYLDKTVAKGYMKSQNLTGFDDPTTSSPGMGVAFPKGSDLTEKVNNILKELEASGEMDKLKDKWLSEYQE